MSIIKLTSSYAGMLLLLQLSVLANAMGETHVVSADSREPIRKDDKREHLTRIALAGVKGVLRKNIEARLPAFKPECSADEEVLQRYQRTVRKKIEKAAKALGYYHSRTSFLIKKINQCWLVEAHIDKGPAVRVNKLDIKITGAGSQTPDFQELPLPYKSGDVLNHLKYKDFKSSLTNAAQEKGYLAAKFIKKEILVDLKKNMADVSVYFDTGKRFRYGQISVHQEVLGKDYVGRYILLKKGDFFSAEGLIEQQQLLQNSGYYSSVSVQADYEQAKQATIPITITLVSAKRDHYKLKMGYGTDTGFRGRISLDRRWTGSAGKKLSLAVGLSQRINEITSSLLIPKKNPEKNNLVYSISVKQEENDDVISESIKVGAILSSLGRGDWKRKLSIFHLSDKTRVKGESSTKSSLTLFGVQYAKVHSDNYIFPRKGWRVRLNAEGALNKLLSDASVLQLKAHGKYIHGLGKGRVLLRTDLGTTFGDRLDNLPKDLRFFAGGINSIRGYDFESLGVINNEGKVIGGKHLLEFSAEYEYPVYEKWSIAAFVDTGNAFDDIATSDFKVGVGAGVRWRSPIGPVRFDIGVPDGDTKDFHIHLSIGPDL